MLPMMPVPVSHPARRRINRLETARPHPDSKPDDHQHEEPLQYLHLPLTRRPARRVRRPLLPLLLRHDEDSGRSQRDDEREKRRDYPCRPAHDGRWRSVVSQAPWLFVPGNSYPEMVYRVRTRRSFAKLFERSAPRPFASLCEKGTEKGDRRGSRMFRRFSNSLKIGGGGEVRGDVSIFEGSGQERRIGASRRVFWPSRRVRLS